MGSLLLGLVSIIGILFVGQGSFLSIAGILLGFIGVREINSFNQNGKGLAIIGMILNFVDIFSLFI